MIPNELVVPSITVYDIYGARTIAVSSVMLLRHCADQSHQGPWGIIRGAHSNQAFNLSALASIDYQGRTLWFNHQGNITEQVEQWLCDNHYTLPLNPSAQRDFTLAWL